MIAETELVFNMTARMKMINPKASKKMLKKLQKMFDERSPGEMIAFINLLQLKDRRFVISGIEFNNEYLGKVDQISPEEIRRLEYTFSVEIL